MADQADVERIARILRQWMAWEDRPPMGSRDTEAVARFLAASEDGNNEALRDDLRRCVELLRLGLDDSEQWGHGAIEDAQEIVSRLGPELLGDVGVAGTAFDDAITELVDAGLATEDARDVAVDPIGAEWERVTRAALAIHVDWSRRERQAIEDFILTVRHSISEIPPALPGVPFSVEANDALEREVL
jgi:hypothetical protein